jgi:hypothetical protein
MPEINKKVEGLVVTIVKDGGETVKSYDLGVVPVDEPHAEIHMEIGHTMNLGNYQSLKLTVGIVIPSPLIYEQMQLATDWAKDWCDTKLSEWIADAKSTVEG